MSFCTARAVELSRTSTVFLMGKRHRMLSVRRLLRGFHVLAVAFIGSSLRFLTRHRFAFELYGSIILAKELWTSEVLSS